MKCHLSSSIVPRCVCASVCQVSTHAEVRNEWDPCTLSWSADLPGEIKKCKSSKVSATLDYGAVKRTSYQSLKDRGFQKNRNAVTEHLLRAAEDAYVTWKAWRGFRAPLCNTPCEFSFRIKFEGSGGILNGKEILMKLVHAFWLKSEQFFLCSVYFLSFPPAKFRRIRNH